MVGQTHFEDREGVPHISASFLANLNFLRSELEPLRKLLQADIYVDSREGDTLADSI